MEKANSFTLFSSYFEALEYLPDDVFGAIMRAMCKYALRGEEPSFDDPVLNSYWTLIRPTLERSVRRAEAGRRGGQSGAGVSRNSGNNNASKSKANQIGNNSDKDKELELELGVGEDIEKEKPSKEVKKKTASTKNFKKPTPDEVQAYCDERGNGYSGQAFCDYYESKGWKIGNSPMKDWKAAVRTWEQRDPAHKPSKVGKQAQPKCNLGVGEFIAQDGTRRYGTGNLPPVPMDAPPRPDNSSLWSRETNTWIPAGV